MQNTPGSQAALSLFAYTSSLFISFYLHSQILKENLLKYFINSHQINFNILIALVLYPFHSNFIFSQGIKPCFFQKSTAL